MAKKKIKYKKSWIIIFVLSLLVVLGFLLIFTNPSFWFKKSVHEDGKKYSTKHCLVFYPDGKTGKEMAKKIAKENSDDMIFDYSLVPYGDYYLVNYGMGYSYFVDKEYEDIVIGDISYEGKKIISDYLRYWVKRQLPEVYYGNSFLEDSYIDNLSFDGVTYGFENENLKCRFPNYDVDVLIPLRYIQDGLNMDFGYPDCLYIKPTYIDSNHPVLCLTFDDGPQFGYAPNESSSVSIVDTLYRYDTTATFYCIGDNLTNRDVWTEEEANKFLKESINNGNEYGSHTQTHEYYMTEYGSEDAIDEAINGPAEYLSKNFNYEMKTYRPPYGFFSDFVLQAQDYPAILYSLDSYDWDYYDADSIYDRVMSTDLYDGDIILFHEIYDTTAKAIKKIIPELIKQGYQLVSVSEMLKYENIDISTLKYYYNLNPRPYYE